MHDYLTRIFIRTIFIRTGAIWLLCVVLPVQLSAAPVVLESTLLSERVARGELPPVVQRIPQTPLVIDLPAKGRESGSQGGSLRTLVSRSKDIRQMVVFGYSRLLIHDENYSLTPDILAGIDIEEERKFTLRLRVGHRWSDGHPFTSADFRYWWEDVTNHPELSPSGPPPVSYTHLRAHETLRYLVCRLLLEKKK